MVIKTNQQVILEGRGPITIRQNDYVATGGEGSIYRAGSTVIKLYTDPNKMLQGGIPDKIKLLSGLAHPYIIIPQGLVLSSASVPIGFYMPFADGEPLPRVFTNDFRIREGFGDQDTFKLVDRMREVVKFAHDKGAILIDANEFNWLALLKKKNDPEPRVIDVDSWVIGRMPSKVAIMPSVRDWHTKGFTEQSDWFSWGIVTFQVFAGIHPYKGTLDGFARDDLEKRMKANASVFASGVRLNRAVRDFSSIPNTLRDWYVATFQQGLRTIPPSPFDVGVAKAAITYVAKVLTATSGLLILEKLYGDSLDPVTHVWPCGVVLRNSGILVDLDLKRTIGRLHSKNGEVIKVNQGWLIADWIDSEIVFSFISEGNFQTETLALPLRGYKILRYENRLFLVTDRGLTEVIFKMFGKPILSVDQTWGALVNSTRWFDGVGIQDAMGAMYIIAPFGDRACTHIRVRELDGLRVLAAKAGNRFIIVIAADRSGTYHKFELTLSRDYTSYQIWQGIIDNPDLNIAILPKGVCATIVTDGELVIFVPTSGAVNKISDKHITTDLKLFNWDNKVVYINNGVLWNARLK